MTGRTVLMIGTLALIVASSAGARPVTYQPLAETIPAALADDGGTVVVAHCATCHSLDYITTQPRGKGAQFWRDEVSKMVNVYKAPVSPEDAAAIADNLGKRFGGG
jgi:cytochrome c5